MPHYKDGTRARLFDRIRAPLSTSYEPGHLPRQNIGDAVVVGIIEGATSCELQLLIGGGEMLGSLNLPTWGPNPVRPPLAGVVLSGGLSSANAKDCELAPRDS
jgi:hypothetical protein